MDLVEAIKGDVMAKWRRLPEFHAAAIHASIDGHRVFTYSHWGAHVNRGAELDEFFIPESHSLEITAARSVDQVTIDVGDRLTHLAEFRMHPSAQPKMIELTTDALDKAMAQDGLLSATFHTSLDQTRMFNYGQWTSQDAFTNLETQPGFSKDDPYWSGLARNEFHLYTCVHVDEL